MAGVNDAKAGVNENQRPKKAISSSRWTHTLTVRAHARGFGTAEYIIQRAAGADSPRVAYAAMARDVSRMSMMPGPREILPR